MVWTRIFLKAETNLRRMDLPTDPGKPQITGSAINVSSQAFDRSQEISQGSLNHDELSSANVLFHADYALHQQEDPLRVGKPPMHNSSIFSGSALLISIYWMNWPGHNQSPLAEAHIVNRGNFNMAIRVLLLHRLLSSFNSGWKSESQKNWLSKRSKFFRISVSLSIFSQAILGMTFRKMGEIHAFPTLQIYRAQFSE